MNKLPVIIIVGPTASGKTSLAVQLAKKINGEVISADSRQVYSYMDIGTAKPNEEEKEGVLHYGFDVVNPGDRYSAGLFAKDARLWVNEIYEKGKNVVVAGGSGLYLEAMVDGFFSGDDYKDENLRDELEKRADSEGLDVLFNELQGLDPEYSSKNIKGDR